MIGKWSHGGCHACLISSAFVLFFRLPSPLPPSPSMWPLTDLPMDTRSSGASFPLSLHPSTLPSYTLTPKLLSLVVFRETGFPGKQTRNVGLTSPTFILLSCPSMLSIISDYRRPRLSGILIQCSQSPFTVPSLRLTTMHSLSLPYYWCWVEWDPQPPRPGRILAGDTEPRDHLPCCVLSTHSSGQVFPAVCIVSLTSVVVFLWPALTCIWSFLGRPFPP